MSKKASKIMLVLFAAMYILVGASSVAMAQEESGFTTGLFDAGGAAAFGAAIGAGLVIIGGARGISRIGASAVESMARQPEASGSINVAMIITAAMIEGATLFAVIVCLLALP
jgi:F-type H+-transporting ATPase subunit c